MQETCLSLYWCPGFHMHSPQPATFSRLGMEGAVWAPYLLSERHVLHRAAEEPDWELWIMLDG